jgi:hypothetical protein
MTQKRINVSVIQTYNKVNEIRRQNVLIEAFWNELENFDCHGLTDEQRERFESMTHLIHLYQSQTVPALVQLMHDLDGILQMIREAPERDG